MSVARPTSVSWAKRRPERFFADESPIGKEVRVQGVIFKVVGVLEPQGREYDGNGPGRRCDRSLDDREIPHQRRETGLRRLKHAALNPTAAANQVISLSKLYPTQPLPLYPQRSVAETADQPQPVRFVDLDDIYLSVRSSEDVPQTIDEITQLLRRRHALREGQPDDFSIRDWSELSKMMSSTSALMTNLLLCVAPISLLVGGIGIMNMMLVSVTERTREIGIRRAMGARARDIRRQFLAEAIMLCLCGGIAGIALGRSASFLLTVLLGWPTIPSLTAILIAVAVATSVGIIFGYYPAWKASRLDPIEALRYE
jgi:hypothetical protein